ncbi:ABC transporter substrate-binding protein [Sporichthya polymorpha]|uniref:ABC transporter substrate-binding protein n=1 Tax=Sporichthya polymorpha TaxID=35751 RepID=UPI00037D2EB3|nr:ABC transporter substrate-binding protein [Sporichthya polymorpha]
MRGRLGVAALVLGVFAAGSGCGSQASDAEIAEALRGPALAAGTGAVAAAPGTTTTTTTGTEAGAAGAASLPGQAPADGAGPSAAVPGQSGSASTASAGSGGPGKAAAGTAGAAGAKAPGVANKSPIKIGTLGPYSGVLGALCAPAAAALRTWVSWKNANGGVNGHPIELIVGDDNADPTTGMTLAKRMVEQDKILAIVGDVIILNYDQIQEYMESKNIPMIGSMGTLQSMFTAPNQFTVSSYAGDAMDAVMSRWVKEGADKLGIAYCLEVSIICSALSEDMKKTSIGKNIVGTYQVSLVAPSYTSVCLQMKQAGVQGAAMFMDTAGAARLVKDCATQGFTPKWTILGLDATPEYPGIPALKDVVIPGATFPPVDLGKPAIKEYLQGMAAYAPGVGYSGMGSYAWSAGQMFAHAGRSFSDNPTSQELFESLWKVRNEDLGGLIGPVSYVKGKGTITKPCTFIWGVDNGKFTAPNGLKQTCSSSSVLPNQ